MLRSGNRGSCVSAALYNSRYLPSLSSQSPQCRLLRYDLPRHCKPHSSTDGLRRSHRSMGDVVVCQAALNTKNKTTKQKLLDKAAALNRGVSASAKDKEEIESLIQAVERTNPTREPLKSPLINGRWELKYTTSASILGTGRPPFLRPSGPIYQVLDAPNGKAANRESAPFFNQVKADITPESSSCVAVQFRQFKVLGMLPVNAPESAKGKLDTTYLDKDLRISRGDKGNVFVLTMDDPNDRP